MPIPQETSCQFVASRRRTLVLQANVLTFNDQWTAVAL